MAVNYTIDMREEGRSFPHYWELCVGSCHAATVLREDVRRQIKEAHEKCGFQYLRFHGLFDDDMSVVIAPMGMGEPEISFYNVDSIFDFLLEIGMKPFVEIGFMPEFLASGEQTCFHYKGNVTMPAEDEKWIALIRAFAEHLVERYGKEEVATWFFEVWNEPNLRFFFDGTQEDYFHLYEMTAATLKSVGDYFKVGGPATSVNAWIPEFRSYCEKNQIPLDFITTHHYPSDDPLSTMGMNGPGTKGTSPMDPEMMEQMKKMPPEELKKLVEKMLNRENHNPRNILAEMTKKAKEEAGDYPFYYTEWNGSMEFDTSYQAAFVAQTIAYNENLVEGYSYWTVSDIFEEMGLHAAPFNNEFGMQTKHGIKKPVFYVFQVLHEAGDRRLAVKGESHPTAEVLALKSEKEVTVLVYNHDLERRNIKPEEIALHLEGNVRAAKKAVIAAGCADPKKIWEEMGSPRYLKQEQVDEICAKSSLIYEELETADTYTFHAPEESVTIFKFEL